MLSIRPVFVWYDWWLGGYWARNTRTLYLMVPFVGVTIHRHRYGNLGTCDCGSRQ